MSVWGISFKRKRNNPSYGILEGLKQFGIALQLASCTSCMYKPIFFLNEGLRYLQN